MFTLLRTLPQACLILCLVLLAPGFSAATVFGVDDRLRADARLDEADEQRYSATQVISCRRGKGREHIAAGNLALDFTHGVSIAHVFHPRGENIDYRADECVFQVRDRNGRRLDQVAVKQLKTFWQGRPHRAENDLAMFELERRPRHVTQLLSLDTAPVQAGQQIMLVAFHYDVKPYLSKRKTRGLVYSTLGSTAHGLRNIFNTDVDGVPMSSGGPLYDQQGRLVALIQGTSNLDEGARSFDGQREYNSAIRLDAQFLRDYAGFVRSAD
jgi:hypothetical protein